MYVPGTNRSHDRESFLPAGQQPRSRSARCGCRIATVVETLAGARKHFLNTGHDRIHIGDLLLTGPCRNLINKQSSRRSLA